MPDRATPADTCQGVRALLEPVIITAECPKCRAEVEFFDYETEATCASCGEKVYRQASPSCVVWCKYASKCISDLKEKGLITPSRAEELRISAGAGKS